MKLLFLLLAAGAALAVPVEEDIPNLEGYVNVKKTRDLASPAPNRTNYGNFVLQG